MAVAPQGQPAGPPSRRAPRLHGSGRGFLTPELRPLHAVMTSEARCLRCSGRFEELPAEARGALTTRSSVCAVRTPLATAVTSGTSAGTRGQREHDTRPLHAVTTTVAPSARELNLLHTRGLNPRSTPGSGLRCRLGPGLHPQPRPEGPGCALHEATAPCSRGVGRVKHLTRFLGSGPRLQLPEGPARPPR